MFLEIKNRRSHEKEQPPRGLAWRPMPLGDILTRQLKIHSEITYSGSVGNKTYSHNKGGQYIRQRSIPTNPNTERQGEVRTFLANYAVDWSAVLTQEQRDNWRTYAEGHTHTDVFGNPIHLPPHCWFIMLNSRLADAGGGWIANPPGTAAPSGFDTMSAAFTADNSIDLTFTPAIDALHRVQLWQSLPVSVGSTPNLRQCRLVGYSAQGQASPWSATLVHNIIGGTRGVFFGFVMDDFGQLSSWMADIEDR